MMNRQIMCTWWNKKQYLLANISDSDWFYIILALKRPWQKSKCIRHDFHLVFFVFSSRSGVFHIDFTWPIIWHSRKIPWWWPLLLRFSIWFGLYFIPQWTWSDWPLFQQKIVDLSLSNLFLEIIGPKIGLIIHPNWQKWSFEALCINVLLDFQSSLLLFHCPWIFLSPTPILTNFKSDWVHFYHC